MTQQRNDEWVNFNAHQLSYHTKQWDEQKDSTLAFYNFVKHKLSETNCLIDLGAGTGAATSYIAKKTPKVSIIAADYGNDFFKTGKKLAKNDGVENLSFHQVDWFQLKETNEFDGMISLQKCIDVKIISH